MGQPGDAHAIPDRNPVDACAAQLSYAADNLVTGDERQPDGRELAIDDVQVGTAYAARVDLHQHLTGTGSRIGNRGQLQRGSRGA